MRYRAHLVAAALLVAVLGMLMPGAAPMAHSAAQPLPQTKQPPTKQPQRPNVLAVLELTDMSPRVVTATSPSVLTVNGRVVNVGDRVITKLGVRLQRDEPVSSDEAAARAVRSIPEAPHITRFQPVSEDLAPGQSSPFQLEVPLRGGAELESLQISEPGVYPLLVNLNGKPDFGGTARLASVTLLLPVLGIPPAAPGGPAGPVLRPPRRPAALTVVWPLTTEPARLPTGPGEPILIRSNRAGTDPVAADIAPGGRLDGVLGALEQVVPPGSPLSAAVCVAIDPLLLETVDGMSRGYRVAHPGGISEGTGERDARSWLDRLRSAVQGRCVLPLPYADPDLVALSRAGLTDLEALAISTGIRLVGDLLGVQPLTGISWPAGEVLDERTLADLTALEIRAVLLEPGAVFPQTAAEDVVSLAAARLPGAGIPVSGRGAAPTGLLVDSLLTSALVPAAGWLDTEAVAVSSRPTGTPSPLAAQDGLGALVYRAAIDPDRQPVLLAPPRHWQARGTEATALLSTARQLLEAGYFAPRGLPALATTRPAGPTTAVAYPPQADAQEIPRTVTADVRRDRDVLRDLEVATVLDATTNLKPVDLLDPLRLGLLRGVSSAWRGHPDRATQVTGQESSRLDELRRSVRLVQSPGPYSLAASNSPLLITVSNELPVGVQVALSLSETAGLQTGAVGVQLVPARSTRQFVIPAKVSRAGQFSVDARLGTPGGTPLGEPSTLQLRSTAFGTVTVALTAGAAAALVLLVARRFVRRARRARKAG
ncbi:MAG TPA: DUF6049 family protein [Pseudonocardiaceae bacterium]|nr:DUF6049 family protein [Pseudonocardiaceae bacterium]